MFMSMVYRMPLFIAHQLANSKNLCASHIHDIDLYTHTQNNMASSAAMVFANHQLTVYFFAFAFFILDIATIPDIYVLEQTYK